MTRAGIYTRISYIKRGGDVEILGATKQIPSCEKLARDRGWEIAEHYTDDDLSAYKGKRPGFERMLADAQAGRIDAIVCWAHDRLTRDPDRDNTRILDLTDRLGLHLATVTGEYDLGAPAGRMLFRQLGVVARFESEHRAERVAAHHDRLAAKGRWHGGRRPFGYRYLDDGAGIKLDATEAKAIQLAAERILHGGKLTAIAREWRREGLMASKGGRPVTVTTLDRLLRSPHLVGDRVHRGKVTKREAWPAILDRDVQEAVVAVLDSRRRKLRDRHRTLLGGMLRCGACGHVMRGATVRSTGGARMPGYRCDAAVGGCGRLHRLAKPVDDEVTGRVLATLANPNLRGAIEEATAAKLTATQRADVRRTLAGDRAKLAQLDGIADELGEQAAAELRGRIEARMASTSQQLAAAVLGAPLDDLSTITEELEAAWGHWSVDRRREVLGFVIEEVTLVPVGRGRRAGPEHVKVRWRF